MWLEGRERGVTSCIIVVRSSEVGDIVIAYENGR